MSVEQLNESMDQIDNWDDDSSSGEEGVQQEEAATVDMTPRMRFCERDSSMLYPKEDVKNKKLLYACRHCDYVEAADHGLIYSNRVKKVAKNILATIPDAVIDDPTLARRELEEGCEMCGYKEAVFFQSDESYQTKALSLIFVCCNCSHKWVSDQE